MERFFRYLNLFPMPLWLAMMVAPRHPWTERAARSSGVLGLAALHYVAAIGLALRAGQPGVGLSELTSLGGIQRLLATREGTTAAWAHMLALDLFTGTWIYRQARRLDAPGWVRVPSLFFTLMSGPVGLLIFLLWRTLGTPRGEALAGVRM